MLAMMAMSLISIADKYRDAISEIAVAKSGRVLYAFAHFYFPFYQYKPSDIFWKYTPFAWISAYVYDVDEEIEQGSSLSSALQRLQQLRAYLQKYTAIDPAIEQLFENAAFYYQFEQELLQRKARFSLDDLYRITEVRSFDFRLMHRTLAQLSGIGYREPIFEWFRALEVLMEIEDDMLSVEEDYYRNTFNFVCLANQCAGSEGIQFVEQARQLNEERLVVVKSTLPEEDRYLCDSVLKAYREVVPHSLPTDFSLSTLLKK